MRILAISAVAVVLGVVNSGCAAQSPTYEKRLAEMREKVMILQNERDRLEERLAAVEARQESMLTLQQPVPQRSERPPLKVFVLQPEQALAPGDTRPASEPGATESPEVEGESGAATPRPLISGEGKLLHVTEKQQ